MSEHEILQRLAYLEELAWLARAGSAPATAGGWHTAYDVDFTTLPAQTIAVDGPVAIPNNVVPSTGSTTWLKGASAGEAIPLAIIPGPGEGLIFQPTNSPNLSTPLYALIPPQARLWTTQLRLYIYTTQTNSTTGAFVVEAIDATTIQLYGSETIAANITLLVIGGSVSYEFEFTDSLANPTDVNVSVLEIDGFKSAVLSNYYGNMQPGDVWPTDQQISPFMNILGNLSTADASFVWGDPSVPGPGTSDALDINNIQLLVGVEAIGQVGFKYGVGRLRLDYKL
jgi:hypothetical protein